MKENLKTHPMDPATRRGSIEKERTVNISVRMNPDEHKMAQMVAQENNTNIAQFCRMAILREALRRQLVSIVLPERLIGQEPTDV